MIWYDMIYDMIRYDIWYGMIWYMLWYMLWYGMIWYMLWYAIWYGTIWYDICYDTIRYDIYDMIYDMLYDKLYMIWYNIIVKISFLSRYKHDLRKSFWENSNVKFCHPQQDFLITVTAYSEERNVLTPGL